MNVLILSLVLGLVTVDHSRELTPKPDPSRSQSRQSVTLNDLPPDDCGACQTKPSVQYITPDPHYTTLEWTQPGTCTGWNVWESVNPSLHKTNWWLNTTKMNVNALNNQAATNVDVRVVVFSTNNPVYWRVSAY